MIKILLVFIVCLVIILLIIERFCRYHDKPFCEIINPHWFNDVTKFPYEDFVCEKNCDEYHERVKKGYEIMKNIRIVIGGLCINIENNADILRKRLEHFGSFFKDYACVIFENDSKDNTRNILKKFSQENEKIVLVPCPEDKDCKLKQKTAVSNGVISQKRMKVMADYRNRLLNFIKEKYSTFDVVCFLDLDIKGPINMDGVAHSFSYYPDWDTISAFGVMGPAATLGKLVYYDALAYDDGETRFNNYHSVITVPLKNINKKIGDRPYKVKSGFCSLAFYKMDSLNGVDYTPEDGDYKCEHVILHENLIKKGRDKIYIDPNLIVLVGVQGDKNRFPLY